MQVINTYTAHTDSKKRLTLRKSQYEYYDVKEFENGCLILEPKKLVTPEGISKKSLEIMEESISNMKKGKVSAPIDLSDF